MNEVYRSLGTSKQNFHQRMNRWLKRQEVEGLVLHIIREVRTDHPRMSVRKIFRKMNVQGIGLKRFTDIARQNGLMIEVKRNKKRTTDSSGVIRFPNLIEGKELTAVNQVWVSDITYIDVGGVFCYLTVVMDAFSRRIIGYSVSRRLTTETTTIPAIKMAIKLRGIPDYLFELIIHSDGGGQYYCKEFVKTIRGHGIESSMGKIVYDNAKAERVIGTLKIEYLDFEQIRSFKGLERAVERTVKKYNWGRPHDSLGEKTPVEFELSTNSQKFTKEKRSKKENINDDNNMFTVKTVNGF